MRLSACPAECSTFARWCELVSVVKVVASSISFLVLNLLRSASLYPKSCVQQQKQQTIARSTRSIHFQIDEPNRRVFWLHFVHSIFLFLSVSFGRIYHKSSATKKTYPNICNCQYSVSTTISYFSRLVKLFIFTSYIYIYNTIYVCRCRSFLSLYILVVVAAFFLLRFAMRARLWLWLPLSVCVCVTVFSLIYIE